MTDLVVFGAGEMAEVATAHLRRHTDHRIVAYALDAMSCGASTFHGCPVVAWETLGVSHPADRVRLLCPLSDRPLNALRRERYLQGKARGYSFVSFIHPSCHVYTEHIGENCLILENSVLQPFVRIGNNVVMGSGSQIGHDAVIGDHCSLSDKVWVSPGSTLGAGCFLGRQAGIGAGVRVGQNCVIDECALVAAGDVPDGAVFAAKSSRKSRSDSSRIARLM